MYQVDAFSNRLFGGNPAAVVMLERWLDDSVMQAIARENNLSETAFVAPEGDEFRIRWFTPAVEVDLCGHATLATAFVLFDQRIVTGEALTLASRSGTLSVRRDGDLLTLDFPTDPPTLLEGGDTTTASLGAALGERPREWHAGRYHLAVFDSEDQVAGLSPDMAALRSVDHFAVVCTAPGKDCDFVSRFFGPRVGVDEDPVTGSAHCMLVPYWSGQLGRKELHAKQISARGGELFCKDRGDRADIAGHAVQFMQATVQIRPD